MAIPHALGPTLELIREGRSARVYELKGTELYIGRVPDLDVFLDDARVSRRHARIEHRMDGTFHVVDLDSKGSTELNGRRLTPFQPSLLSHGSRIKIVGFELVFHDHAVELDETLERDSTILESIDNLSNDQLARRSVEPAEALKAILEINQALGGGAELNEMLGRALDGLMNVFPGAERGFILVAGHEGRPRLRALRHRTGTTRLPVLSRSMLNQVLKDGKAILIKDAAADPRFLRARSVVSTFKTALCVPLLGRDGRPLGMVQIDRMKGRKGFKAGDLDLLAALAVPVGVAVENDRLLKERASWAAAREIQLSLLPHGRPEVPGYAFWDCYSPTLEVGGDLYDYIAVEPSAMPAASPAMAAGRWVVVIGDVAGKGMPAALLVAGICPEVRHLVRAGVAPEEVLSQVNRTLCDREVGGRFVTMALVAVDPESHVLTVVKAGHPEPLVRRASGAIEPVGREGAGPPLGVTPRSVYKPVAVRLAPGESVILYTDGVIESMDRERRPFGMEQLLEVAAKAPQGAAAAGEAILAAVRDHATDRSQYDDITIVCFERVRG
jgi:sigma-B regulation protein RsbU (phosphoserine phosphatase)